MVTNIITSKLIAGLFLFIAAEDDKFDMEKTGETLKKLGALNLEVIKDHGTATVGVEETESGSTSQEEAEVLM